MPFGSADPSGKEKKHAPTMRLLIDGHRLTSRRTGVGRVLEMLLDEWSATGWPFEQVVLLTQQPVDPLRWYGLKGKTLGKSLPGSLWRQAVLAPRTRRDDILFCPTNLLPRSVAAKRVVFVFDTLLEAQADSFPWHVRARFRNQYRSSARRADTIIVPSSSTRRDVLHYYGVDPEKVRIAPLAADPLFDPAPTKGEPGFRQHPTSPYFLIVGKLSRRRNIDTILAAFAEHHWNHPEDKLVIVGPQNMGSCPDQIVCLDHLPDQDLAVLYRSARALLYLSDYEGFGLPILEAQNCGCPVLTLPNSALKETAGNGALYLDKAAPEPILQAMGQLRNDESLRTNLIAKGFLNAARFSRRQLGLDVAEILKGTASAGSA